MKESATFKLFLRNLSKLSASEIRAEIEKMATHGKSQKDWVMAEKFIGWANGASCHFHMILNPQDCTPENIEHAKKHGKPIPTHAAACV